MARGRSGTGKGLSGLRSSGGEAVQLVIDYVKQETLTPLRGLGRYILFGVAGSVALAIGLVILAVGFLRFLQGETGSTFSGNLSWVPYLICTVAVVAVAGGRRPRREPGPEPEHRRPRKGDSMTSAPERISRDDIEAKFRELTGEVSSEVESTRSQVITVGLAVGVALVAVVFLIGRRNGRRRSAVVEVRRI